jgi:hypothetical protein
MQVEQGVTAAEIDALTDAEERDDARTRQELRRQPQHDFSVVTEIGHQMTTINVAAFVKFFSDESHADQFMKGLLYMRRPRYFRRLESSEKEDGRSDAHEATVSWHQPDRIELVLNFPGFEPIKLGKNDLAGPLAITRNFYSLFCMSALSIPDPALLQGDHDEVQAKLQTAFQIDARCLDFGPHAVVVSAEKFLPQLHESLERSNHWFKTDMVEYYDETTFHGDFAEEDVPFRKQIRFAYQKEFRVCLQTPTAGDEPLTFDIGDMSAFAIKVRSADINASLKVTLKDPSS